MIDPTLKLMMDAYHANVRNVILMATIKAITEHIDADLSEMNAEQLADIISNEMQVMRGAISVAYTEHAIRFEAARIDAEMEGVIDDMEKRDDR